MTFAPTTTQQINMPARNHTLDQDEIRSLSSEYTFPTQNMAPSQVSLFPFSQTEPSTDMSLSLWGSTTEGTQNLPDFPEAGSPFTMDHENFFYTSGASTPRGAGMEHAQAAEHWTSSGLAVGSSGGQAMSRMNSDRSSVSSLSRSPQLSALHSVGNVSAFQNGPQAEGSIAGMTALPLEANVDATSYWQESYMDMPIGQFPLQNISPMQTVSSQVPLNPAVEESSPVSWDCLSLTSQSSPSTLDNGHPSPPLSPSSSNGVACISPNVDRKPFAFDEYTLLPGQADEPSMLDNLAVSRQQPLDADARSDPLYTDAKPQADGLYHCPWEGDDSCSHKPEKLKCNYDKFVDSHLKPYRCKHPSCSEARFSSTACRLRHEREAHGLHGHGEKPYICTWPGCDRGAGNGFPRQWNLKDHMRRVHNDPKCSGTSPPTASQQPAKIRKRKTEAPAAQSTSSRKTTVKAMPVAEAQVVSAKPLIEEWLSHRQAVESILQTALAKPDDLSNLEQIYAVQEHLNAMAKMSPQGTIVSVARARNT